MKTLKMEYRVHLKVGRITFTSLFNDKEQLEQFLLEHRELQPFVAHIVEEETCSDGGVVARISRPVPPGTI